MSITLDQDVYSFASAYAEAKGISLSAAVSDLIRRAEAAPEPAPGPSRLKMSQHGYLIISGTGNLLTPAMVKEAAEDGLV